MTETTDRRQTDSWHLEKNISIGHIITTAMVAISLITWGMHMETRIALVEHEQATAKEADARIETQVRESVTRIESLLVRIDAKLDQKVDKKR